MGQGKTPSYIVLPAAYRAELLQKMRESRQPLDIAAKKFFMGRNFFEQLEGRPDDLKLIRTTLVSPMFFG